jgi:hypothetical protein
MKKTSILILLSIFSFQVAFSQVNTKSIVYVNRLKKSTESTTTYSIWVDDKNVGIFEGTNPIFTQNYFGSWIVFSIEANNKTVFEIKNSKDNQSVGKLVVNLKPNEKYFITFDSSVAYNNNPLKLIENKEGFDALYNSSNESIKIGDEEIRKEVFYDKKYGYLKYVKVENADSLNAKPAIIGANDVYSIIFSNKNDRTFERIQDVLNYSEKVNQLIKESEFDYYKSYGFEPSKENSIMAEIKKSMNEFIEGDNVLIYYFDKEKRIYIAVNHLIKK